MTSFPKKHFSPVPCHAATPSGACCMDHKWWSCPGPRHHYQPCPKWRASLTRNFGKKGSWRRLMRWNPPKKYGRKSSYSKNWCKILAINSCSPFQLHEGKHMFYLEHTVVELQHTTKCHQRSFPPWFPQWLRYAAWDLRSRKVSHKQLTTEQRIYPEQDRKNMKKYKRVKFSIRPRSPMQSISQSHFNFCKLLYTFDFSCFRKVTRQ